MKRLLLVVSMLALLILSGCAQNDNLMPGETGNPMTTARPGDGVNPAVTGQDGIPNIE